MYENGIFQIWHKKSKNGKFYTALVSVDRFGKLKLVFDETQVLLACNFVKDHLKSKGFVCNSIYDVFKSEQEFKFDIEHDCFV